MRRLSIGLNAMVKHDRKNQDGPINRRELMLKSSLPVSRKNVFSEANDQDDAQHHESSLLRRKSIQEYFQDIHLDDGPQTPRTGSGGFIPMPHENMEWDRLENVEFLAQGGMCRVLSATLHGVPCVIKIGRDDHANPEVVKLSLKDEITVLRRLKHPNVVGYYGSGRGADGGLFLVLERLDHRALHHRLGTAPGAKKQTARGVPLLARLKWGLELATGMAYLHDRAVPGSMVLHRDLKPENLGFGADGRLKIMDMGLALIVDRHFRSRADRYKMSGQVGSARYMSPEVAQRQRYNEKADVHSFAVILWEMLALRLPFADMDLESFTREVVEGGMRPPLKKEWGDDLKDLMTQAWDPDPDVRPSFREVAGHMECILAEEIERAPAPPRGGGGGGGGGEGSGGGGGGLGRRLTERIRGRNGSSASASEPNSPRDSITNAYQKRASSTETAPSSRRGLSLKGLGAALSRTVSRRRRGRNSNSASEDSPGAGVEVGAVGGLGGRRAQPRSWSQADAMDAGGEGMFNPEGFLADSEEEDDNELDNSLGGKKILPDKRRAKRVSSLPESTGHGGGHGKKPEFRMPHIMRKLDTNSAQRFQSQQISNSIDSSYNSALQESAHSTSIPGIEETGITIPELDDEDEQEEMMMVTPPTRRTASMGEIKGHVSSSKKGPSLSRQPSGQENGPPARNKGPDPKTGSSMESNGRSPDHSSTPTPRTAVKASPRMVVKASPRRLKSPAAACAGEGLPPPPLPGGDGPGAPPEVAAAPLLPLVAGAASPPPAPGDGEGGAPAEEAPGGGGGGRGVDTVEDGCRPRQQQQGAALALQARLRPPQERSVQKPRGAGTNSNRGEQDGGLGGRQISYRVDAPRTGEEC